MHTQALWKKWKRQLAQIFSSTRVSKIFVRKLQSQPSTEKHFLIPALILTVCTNLNFYEIINLIVLSYTLRFLSIIFTTQ